MTRVRGFSAIAVAVLALACAKSDPEEDPTTGSSTGEPPETSAGPSTSGTTVDPSTSSSTSTTTTTGETTIAESSSSSTTGSEACVIEGPQECTQPGYDGPGECDPYAQDCPAGQKCMPYDPEAQGTWDSTRCAPVAADPAGLDEPCTMLAMVEQGGEDTCDVGLVCWDLVGNDGVCAELCGCGDSSPTCEGEGTLCAVSHGGALGVCRPACVPTDLESCGENQVCIFTGDDAFQCINALENAGLGEACEFSNGCAPGLACIASSDCGGPGCCQAYCDVDDPATCDGTCDPLFPSGAPHECYDGLGLCEAG